MDLKAQWAARNYYYITYGYFINYFNLYDIINLIDKEIFREDGRSIRLKTENGYLICSYSTVRYRKDKYEMEKQIEKAKLIIEKPSKKRKIKFTQTKDERTTLNQALIDKTTKLLGLKGYYTDLEENIASNQQVTENLELLPISIYNKTKMISERVLMSFRDKIIINCIRPATVCGLSARMRFDLTVNLLTLQALKNKQITIFNGNQIRPNIHIKDMVRVYEFFIKKNYESNLRILYFLSRFQNKGQYKNFEK